MIADRIAADSLTKRFNNFLAVDSVSFQVKAGEVLVLLGPNGAGKTTTVRMLTSVLKPTSGRAFIAGYDVAAQAEKVRASVGVLTEHHGLYNRMPAEDYLSFFASLYQVPDPLARRRIDDLLKLFGLAGDRRRKLGEYSKGMRQKLALVRAMLHDPPVLLLDEPTSAMDPESARLVRQAICSLRSNERSLVLCTHNLAEAEELADQIAIIRRGRIILHGPVPALKQELLGPAEYEARFSTALDGQEISLPGSVQLAGRGENWLRFRIGQPGLDNPALLRSLLDQNLLVTSLQEVPRSLEQVYMQAVTQPEEA